MKWWVWLMVAGGLLLTTLVTTDVIPVPMPLGKGKKVTNAPVDAGGVVRVAPAELARQAGVTLEVYALARMVRSEHGSGADTVKRWILWAVRNYARKEGLTCAELLLRGRKKVGGKIVPSSSDGYFGAQNTGKYAATSRDPYENDIAIAAAVLTSGEKDPTGGCTQFDSPRAMSSQAGVTLTADELADKRRSEGKEKVLVPGYRESEIRFWRVA